MPEGLFSTKASLDSTDFKTGAVEIQRQVRLVESGFRANAAAMADWSKDSRGLEMRLKALSSEIVLQGKKVALTREEYERMVTVYGANSKEAQGMELRLNKETESLNKMTTELKGTETALENLRAGNEAAGKSADEMGNKQESLAHQLKGSYTEISSAIGLAKQAYQLLKGAVDETIGKFITYAGQVREISQVTGQHAEEVSRMIQVVDDYKIETESLNKVMKKMATEGLPLTIDSLAELSDEYLQLESGVERQIFLTEKFGREGVDFAEIMLAGGDAIRAKSEAVDSGLILDQESLDLARKLELQQDALSDSTLALKVAIGEKLTPAVIEVTKAMTSSITASQLETRARELGIDVTKLYLATMDLANGETIYYTDLLRLVTQAEWDNADATNEGARALARMTTELKETIVNTSMFTGAVLDSATALQTEQAEFGFIIGFARQYEANLENITTAEDNLRIAEENLATARAKWPEGNKHVTDAQTAVDGLKVKLGEAQQASLDATNEMIAGFLQTQLTADGSFTREDIIKVLDYRKAVGLITQEAYDAAVQALKIAENLAAIPDKDINVNYWETHHVNTIYTWTGNRAPGGFGELTPPRGAGGANFLVPPGFPNDSFPLRVESGERVIVIPSDEVAGLDAAMRGMTRNFTQAVNGQQPAGAGAAAGAGMVNNNNDNRRSYVITNAGIDAAELERIQRRQEMLYGG